MQTLRQTISNVRGTLKLLSSDILISDRLLASELRNAANLIVSQQFDKRKLWQSPNLFTPIPCLEMGKIPLSNCCEYTGDRLIAVSKKMLPQIGEGTFGLAIQLVTGIDQSKKFKETAPSRYANLLKLKLTTKDIYYWIQNNHLYVSNEDTELVNLYAYFIEDVPNDLLYPGEDCKCKDLSTKDICINPLDKPFKFPGSRVLDIENIVVKKLSEGFLKLKQDTTSDNKQD